VQTDEKRFVKIREVNWPNGTVERRFKENVGAVPGAGKKQTGDMRPHAWEFGKLLQKLCFVGQTLPSGIGEWHFHVSQDLPVGAHYLDRQLLECPRSSKRERKYETALSCNVVREALDR
jgi:hypothetical protein